MSDSPAMARIARALERMSPPLTISMPDFKASHAYLWRPYQGGFRLPYHYVPLPLSLLQGIDKQREQLLANTTAFAQGMGANHALLWGAKGMGKSSLVKSVIHHINETLSPAAIQLIDVQQSDMPTLTPLLEQLVLSPHRFVLFCDDLAFDPSNSIDHKAYHALKAMLEGSINSIPPNVLIYATSNRRHLTARRMEENEAQATLHEHDAADDKIALSDRFGLWLGFHPCTTKQWHAMLDSYYHAEHLTIDKRLFYQEADMWARQRGGRSGRIVSQFMTAWKSRHHP
ncbi:MAG: ATP-binding protein [Alphaproteobacteria bacterium GM7ARS4]|nr:ATP-binding protein [Alphaproteobacteria bacterium GM7ARS4]